ncbi:MAG TPA: hypothetical protein VIO64_12250 [Pseudobacteroides sp.]|uniref:hypothetical protein n=1 Tax=Pseudobacteroides sp. TaxID=1968840 RepID=UPI002F9242E3
MDKIIATVIVLIIVLGLIAFAILPQQEGVKQMGEKGTTEQQKLIQMVNDPNRVMGSAIRSYLNQPGVKVTIGGSASFDVNTIMDSQVYTMKKTYKTDGSIDTVDFTIVNMGSTAGTSQGSN